MEPSLSDQRIILFNVEGLKEETVRIRNPRKTDSKSFTETLTDKQEHVHVDRVPKHHLELEIGFQPT